MIDVILGTPVWVWLVLAYALWQGYSSTRARSTHAVGIAVLPLLFLALSARSVADGLVDQSAAVLAWMVGLLAAGVAGWVSARRSGAVRKGRRLLLPGDWTVLASSLAFFAAQYWLGYLRASNPAALLTMPLAIIAPAVSGIAAGFPAGRAAQLLLFLRRTPDPV